MWTHLKLPLFAEVIDTMTVWRSGLFMTSESCKASRNG